MRTREFFGDLTSQVKRDELGDVAAMMAYYAIFALFPMMLFVVTIALLVVPEGALAEATAMATQALPEQVGQMIERQVTRMQQAAGGGIAIGGALLALWGASRGSVSLGRALNRVFNRQETRPWWRVQVTGVLVTLAVAALLVVALGLLVVGPTVGHLIADRFGMGALFETFWTLGRWILVAVLVTVVWSLLYRFLPDTRAPFRPFTLGAAAGVAAWIALTLLFALYVRNFGKYDQTYGALGAVIVFVTWLWLSNLALLVGAEINDVLGRSRAGASGLRERRRATGSGDRRRHHASGGTAAA
jgi:membrane protein